MQKIRTAQDVKYVFYPRAPKEITTAMKQNMDLFQQRTAEYADDILSYIPDGKDRDHVFKLLLHLKHFGVQAITHSVQETVEPTSSNLGFGKVAHSTHSTNPSAGKVANGKKDSKEKSV